MKERAKIGIVLLAALLIAVQAADAKSFRLEPGDPHWIKKVDPKNSLIDMGGFWQATTSGSGPRPEIYFKLPEVASVEGYLTFYYGKDIPNSYGWDSLSLWASTNPDGPYTKLWSSQEWGYVEKKEVIVRVPSGYQYLKFHLCDGDLEWEILKLWKDMDITTAGPSPTPTPTVPQPVIPGFEVAFAIAGLLAAVYLLRRRCR